MCLLDTLVLVLNRKEFVAILLWRNLVIKVFTLIISCDFLSKYNTETREKDIRILKGKFTAGSARYEVNVIKSTERKGSESLSLSVCSNKTGISGLAGLRVPGVNFTTSSSRSCHHQVENYKTKRLISKLNLLPFYTGLHFENEKNVIPSKMIVYYFVLPVLKLHET